MEKDKSRGIKHIKDKRKYKGNTTKNAKYVPSKNKPNLGSNLDRYEREENDSEHEHKLSSSTDFALLSNAPISTGSHFRFKSDKIDEKEDFRDNPNKSNDLFCLDLDMLHKSILTIPYYELLGIEKEYFKVDEITTMEKEAQQNEFKFKEFIKSKIPQDLPPSVVTEDKISQRIETKHNLLVIKNDDEILNSLENCNISETNDKGRDKGLNKETCQLSENPKEDLEEWLDDILND